MFTARGKNTVGEKPKQNDIGINPLAAVLGKKRPTRRFITTLQKLKARHDKLIKEKKTTGEVEKGINREGKPVERTKQNI